MTEDTGPIQSTSAKCAKCGACTSVCPVYQVTGRESLTARGRLHLLSKRIGTITSPTFKELFSKCLLCGACAATCPRGIDITTMTIKARGDFETQLGILPLKKWLSRQTIASPTLLKLAGQTLRQINKVVPLLPADSGLRLRLTSIPESPPSQHFVINHNDISSSPNALYFIGCLASHLTPAIAWASGRLLQQICKKTIYAPPAQRCCGMAALSAGDHQQAIKLAQQNIEAYCTPGWEELPIFTSCASCFAQLKEYQRLLANDKNWASRAKKFSRRVQEFSSYLLEHATGDPAFLTTTDPKKRLVYHDPCHLRFAHSHDLPKNTPSAAHQLINLVPSFHLTKLPHGPQCCGQGGLFHISHPGLSKKIGQKLWQDFSEVNSKLVTTTCTGCLLQWQQGLQRAGIPAQVKHLSLLLEEQLRGCK